MGVLGDGVTAVPLPCRGGLERPRRALCLSGAPLLHNAISASLEQPLPSQLNIQHCHQDLHLQPPALLLALPRQGLAPSLCWPQLQPTCAGPRAVLVCPAMPGDAVVVQAQVKQSPALVSVLIAAIP